MLWGASCCLLLVLGCGQSAASKSPAEWLQQAQGFYDNGGFGTRYRMAFQLQQEGRLIAVQQRGYLRGRQRDVFLLEADAQIQLQGHDILPMKVHNRVLCDGTTLHAASRVEGVAQPQVVEFPLTEANTELAASGPTAGQLSPFDLDPLLLWRLAAEHCTFTWYPEESSPPSAGKASGVAQDRSTVQLQGAITPAFRQAAGQRLQIYQPSGFLLTLDRRSGAPLRLELQSDAPHGNLVTTFELWERSSWDDELFQFDPAAE